MKLFIRLAALYFVIIGLASLLAPQAASSHPLSAFDIFVARSLGAALATIGMMNWSLGAKLNQRLRGPLTANLFANASLACIDIYAVHQKIIANSSWFGIGIHALLCAGFIYCLLRNYKIKDA